MLSVILCFQMQNFKIKKKKAVFRNRCATCIIFQPHWCKSLFKNLCCLVIFRRKNGTAHYRSVFPVQMPIRCPARPFSGSVSQPEQLRGKRSGTPVRNQFLWVKTITGRHAVLTAAWRGGAAASGSVERWVELLRAPSAACSMGSRDTSKLFGPSSSFQTRMTAFGPDSPCLF